MGDSMPTPPDRAAGAPGPPPQAASLREWTVYLLALQGRICRNLGSGLYARLLDAAAADVSAGGPAWDVLAPHATRDAAPALALRFMAAVHRVVLEGRAPPLAAHFPSVGGRAGPDGAWEALRPVLAQQREHLTRLVGRPCQTNEVGRCAALAGGFLVIAGERAMPLRLLEIGASAGLNLRWDHYHYADEDDGRSWGDPASPVRLRGAWDVPHALLGHPVRVAARAGCDPRPIDPLSDEGRLALTAPVWADQPVRFERLRGALEVARRLPVPVDPARAVDWLPPQLSRAEPGTATVVYHSVVLQYMPAAERTAVVDLLHAAGATATSDAPLYWLRMEPEDMLRATSVRLTAWPGGRERLLAQAGAHGDPVRWRGDADPPSTALGWGR